MTKYICDKAYRLECEHRCTMECDDDVEMKEGFYTPCPVEWLGTPVWMKEPENPYLRPCPFCQDSHIEYDQADNSFHCKCCGLTATFKIHKTKNDAVWRWNKRD